MNFVQIFDLIGCHGNLNIKFSKKNIKKSSSQKSYRDEAETLHKCLLLSSTYIVFFITVVHVISCFGNFKFP